MRRKDREMSKEFALQLIDNANYGILSLIDVDNQPYGLPLSIVRKEESLYFHSAKGGKKVDSFTPNKSVCVTFVGKTNIPELFSEEELLNMKADESKGVTLASKVFTTEYESAIVFGSINLVDDEQEATEALRLICEKYTPTKMDYFDLAIKSSLSKTNIYHVSIKQISAKRKKYDSSGEEMKWGRLEDTCEKM